MSLKNDPRFKLTEEDCVLVYNMRRIAELVTPGGELHGHVKIMNKTYEYKAWQLVATDRFYIEFKEEE